jgi:hypothetical protein
MGIYCIFDTGQKPLLKGHNGHEVCLIMFQRRIIITESTPPCFTNKINARLH